MPVMSVDGIVAIRDKKPYIRLFKDNQQVSQMSVAEAKNFAMDILQQCSRAEADAMIHQFFSKSNFPQGAADAIMMEFRQFRLELDSELVQRSIIDPDKRPQ